MAKEAKNRSEYISLKEATKYCSYSQDYLSLRARQGKLKAVKIGRNWVTKKEWVEQYLKNLKSFPKKRKKSSAQYSQVQNKIPFSELQKKNLILGFRVLVVMNILLMVGILFFLWKNQTEYALGQIKDNYLSKEIAIALVSEDPSASAFETFQEFSIWLKEKLLVLGDYISQIPSFVFSKPEKEKLAKEIQESKTKEGIVVVSSDLKKEEIERKIKKAFSDKVKIEPKDETSGIIIPLFKTKKEQKYLYIMVPVEEQN